MNDRRFDRDRSEIVLETPEWWGVTVGEQTFLVSGCSARETHTAVAEHIGVPLDDLYQVPVVTHMHSLDARPEIQEKYAGRTVVQVKPFSIEEISTLG